MNVLVTGSDGYIGTLLGPYLMDRGHEVIGLDTGFHRAAWLCNGVTRMPHTMFKDIRQVTADDLRGFDAIVHLAELSNDPVGQLHPEITFKINHLGTVALATKARSVGVRRFVYFSSCSVYGASSTRASDENGAVNPLTAYARCKLLVEGDLGAMAGDDFVPTFLRNATAYGASPRQRFDLVVNNLAGHAWCNREIRMESDGTPWRPFVHVLDICQAAACTLEAPESLVHAETFNVGNNTENYQVKDVARAIADTFPGCRLSIGTRGDDKRDYKVNFDKINTRLPGFKCRFDVAMGAQQLLKVFQAIDMPGEVFESRAHTRLKQIQWLLETRQIDADFFWTA